jgi:hypothetical protein
MRFIKIFIFYLIVFSVIYASAPTDFSKDNIIKKNNEAPINSNKNNDNKVVKSKVVNSNISKKKTTYDKSIIRNSNRKNTKINLSNLKNIPKSHYFYGSLGLIYFQAKEKELEIAQVVPQNTDNHNYATSQLTFKFKSGLKVGLGSTFKNNKWDLYLEYLRYYSTNASKFYIPTWASYFYDFWTNSQNSSYMQAMWKLECDLFNFDIGQICSYKNKILFKPFIGLKSGVINQKLDIRVLDIPFQNMTDAKYISKSWVLGPRIGLNNKFILSKRIDIRFNASLNLLYQVFDVNAYLANRIHPSSIVSSKEKFSCISPNFDLLFGLGDGFYFKKQNYHFDMLAAYEIQYYFYQNFLRKIRADNYGPISASDLILHGLNLSIKLDF